MGKKRRIKKYLQKFGNKFGMKYGPFSKEVKVEELQPEVVAIISETPTLEVAKPEEVVEPKAKPKPKAKPVVKKRQRAIKRKTTKHKTT